MSALNIPPGQIFVIGDSHIGLSDGSERPVTAWLERLARLKPRALYLNGDLFHYLIAHPKFSSSSVEGVMDKFREQALHQNAAIVLNLALQDLDRATVTTVSYRLVTRENGGGKKRRISVT